MEDILALAKKQPNNIDVKMQLVKKYLDKNDFTSAQVILEEIQSLEPENLDANYILAQIYEFDEQYSKAANCFEILLKQQPSFNFKYKLAQLYENCDEFDKSMDLYLECFNHSPNDVDIIQKIAHVNKILGNLKDAVDFYNKILEIDSVNEVALSQLVELYEHTNKYMYYKTRAKVHEVEGALSYAASCYKKALAECENKDNIIELRTILANIFISKNNYDQAIDNYLAILELDTNNSIIYKYLGDAYSRTDNIESACEAYEKALEGCSNNNEIIKKLADLYIEMDNHEKALVLLEKITQCEPQNLFIRVDLARVYFALNRDFEAQESLNFVLNKEPENTNAISVLVDFHLQKKEYKQASEYAEKIKGIIPNSPFGYKKAAEIFEIIGERFNSHFNFGIYHELKGEKQLAVDEFTCALELQPENIDIIVRIAKLYENLAEEYIALEYYQKAVSMDRDNLLILNKMAEIYIRVKEHDNAIAMYKEILALSDKNTDIYYILGDLCEKVKDRGSALDFYGKFIKLAPLSVKTEEVKTKIRKLEELLTVDEEEGIMDKLVRFFNRGK